MDWFVLPPEKATWTVSPEEFKRALEVRWPGASAQIVQGPATSVEYEVPMRHGLIWGRLDDRGQVFTFEKDADDCAAFAVWIRTLVPLEHPLVFIDEGYTHDILLRPETTAQDILRAFEIEPSPESAP